ncbi:MAG: hypothetical protein LBM92_04820 [Opitutaceae bacterium]|jgi:hypothetical protein|nr:hypothetical protein [Opitutaceae bacterium]
MKPAKSLLKTTALAFALALAASACPAATGEAAGVVVFKDNFDKLPSGVLLGVVGAEAEYHYIRATSPVAGWAVSTYRSEVEWQRAWRGIEVDGRRMVGQFMKNTRYADVHPMLAAGNPLWQDYTVSVRFIPHATSGICGVVFRCQTDRRYYALVVEKGKAFIKLVKDGAGFRVPYEKILDEKAFPYKAGKYINAVITVSGGSIRATLNDDTVLGAVDTAFPRGGIALVSDVPATFAEVTVTMTPENKNLFEAAQARVDADECELQANNPKPVVWKKIQIGNFGIGRNFRFGDLDGDGQKEIVIAQVRHHGPKDANAEISCVTAINLDGKILWQVGEPDPWNSHLSNDVAFQIHDIDGDGRNEVIYTMGRRIIVADGATGKEKYSAPTPERPAVPQKTKRPPAHNKWFPRILGDSIAFCDVRGTGRNADILIKDRYTTFWVLDDKLNLLWSAQCVTGHYPFPCDIDGDGKDEIAIGYSLYSHDGKLLWTLDDKLQDHDDGLAVFKMHPDDKELSIFIAGSDEGVIITDVRGNILKHHYIGHVQNPGVADFRPDLPGLETVTVNFWGNQGIIHFFDSKGEIYHVMEPFQHGSVCLPVNWTGKPGEFVMLSPNHEDGGLFDGWGRRVVRLPADGHPDLAYHALDLTGDCRDEIVVWDLNEIWIYTQDDNPKPGKLYQPVRPGWLSNDSNYRAYFSLPPGSDLKPYKIDKGR